MTLDTIIKIIWICNINWGRHSHVTIWLACNGVANHDSSIEHLLLPVGLRMMIVIWIGSIHCEVICNAPHSSRAISHIEAFLPCVNEAGCSPACSMIELFILRDLTLSRLKVVDLSLIGVPYQAILYPLDLHNSRIPHGLLEIRLNTLPFLRPLVYLMYWQEVIAALDLVDLFPMLWKADILCFFKEVL